MSYLLKLFKPKEAHPPTSKWQSDNKYSSALATSDTLPPDYDYTGSGNTFFGSGTKKVDGLPGYAKYEVNDVDLKKTLGAYDTIFVVDDSTSMTTVMASGRTRWDEACEALADFSELAARFDNDGIDIYFFNSSKSAVGLHHRSAVEALFHEMEPRGATYIGRRLQQLADPYLSQLAASKRNALPKPRNYIIITDGKTRDEDILRNFISSAANSLHSMKCPPGQLGFQFVQIGNNAGATQFLEDLDGDRKSHTFDIVDTVKADLGESFSADFPKKVLLGGINRKFDRQPLPIVGKFLGKK